MVLTTPWGNPVGPRKSCKLKESLIHTVKRSRILVSHWLIYLFPGLSLVDSSELADFLRNFIPYETKGALLDPLNFGNPKSFRGPMRKRLFTVCPRNLDPIQLYFIKRAKTSWTYGTSNHEKLDYSLYF